MSFTPDVPMQIYALSSADKKAGPLPLSSMLSQAAGNSLVLDGNGYMFVAASAGTTINGLSQTSNQLTLSYTDAQGNPGSLSTAVVTDVAMALDLTDPQAPLLKTTVNGVTSVGLDVSALVADINVEEVDWDPATMVLTLTETNGTTHTIDLSSLVAVSVSGSIEGDGTTASALKLVGDATAPGQSMRYGTNSAGVKGWYKFVSTDTSNIAKVGTDGGVFVGPLLGTTIMPVILSQEAVPTQYIGDPTVNLYAPHEWRVALDPLTGNALTAPDGKRLMIPLFKEPEPPIIDQALTRAFSQGRTFPAVGASTTWVATDILSTRQLNGLLPAQIWTNGSTISIDGAKYTISATGYTFGASSTYLKFTITNNLGDAAAAAKAGTAIVDGLVVKLLTQG